MRENSKPLNKPLTKANLASKAIEIIRALEADEYDPLEIFKMGEQIIYASVDYSPAAHVYRAEG